MHYIPNYLLKFKVGKFEVLFGNLVNDITRLATFMSHANYFSLYIDIKVIKAGCHFIFQIRSKKINKFFFF